MSVRSIHRPGFSLIELLVVIAIISLLIGLLLPAVQKVRDGAARLQCQNNLKQIGLALLSYHTTYEKFPPAYEAKGYNSGPGWGTFILPFLEQGALSQQVPIGPPFWGSPQAISTVASGGQTPLKVFRCPSDIGTTQSLQMGNFAVSNYRATAGTLITFTYPNDPAKLDLGGVMCQNSCTRICDITDGTSNTLIVGEGRTGMPRRVSTKNTISTALWCGMTGQYNVPGIGNFVWIDNVFWPTGGGAGFGRDYVDEAFNSRHSSGRTHFAFGDGSVRGFAKDIDPNLRAQLGVRNDGLPISVD